MTQETNTTEIVAPQLGAPEGAQAEVDSAQAAAAAKKDDSWKDRTYVIVRLDDGAFFRMANGKGWYKDNPLRKEDGKFFTAPRHLAEKMLPHMERDGLKAEAITMREFEERRESKSADDAAGLWKTLSRCTGRAEFAADQKRAAPSKFAEALAPLADETGGKPGRGKKGREKGDRRRDRDDA